MTDKGMIYLLGPETIEGKARFRANDRDIANKFIAQGWREVTVEEYDAANPDDEEAALRRIEALLKKHEDQIKYFYSTGSVVQRIEAVLRHYESQSVRALSTSKRFRDDVLVTFRALALIADMTGNAGTHAEKNARLRGMGELLEAAVKKLGDMAIEFADDYWHYDDIFRSDYPVRHYKERIYELEREVERLRKDPNGDQPADEASF